MEDASNSAGPVVLAVDDDAAALARIERELTQRYGWDYRVVCEPSPRAAAAALRTMQDEGSRVAIVLAAQWMSEAEGTELLGRGASGAPGVGDRGGRCAGGDHARRPRARRPHQVRARGGLRGGHRAPWRTALRPCGRRRGTGGPNGRRLRLLGGTPHAGGRA